MLICFRYADTNLETHELASLRIGLVVRQWHINKDVRIFVLLPKMNKEKPYCEVHAIYSPIYEWYYPSHELANNPVFGHAAASDEKLPNITDITEEDLYCVWDDGVTEHPERAERLYSTFKQLIDDYANTALALKEEYIEQEYQFKLANAKKQGWDTELIQLKSPIQPYGSY